MKNKFLIILILIYLIISITSASSVVLGEYKVDFQFSIFDEKDFSTDLVQHQGKTLPDTSGKIVSWNSYSALIRSSDGKANITLIEFNKPSLASKEDLVYEIIEKLGDLGYKETSLYGINDDFKIDGHPYVFGVPKDNKDNLYVAAFLRVL